jgi:hypothetical protein
MTMMMMYKDPLIYKSDNKNYKKTDNKSVL